MSHKSHFCNKRALLCYPLALFLSCLPIQSVRTGQIVNKELELVKILIDENFLSLNISKTNYIIFHSPFMSIPSLLLNDIIIKIGSKHINRSKYIKVLRILLDENLNCKLHLSELSKKLARMCGIQFKIRDLLETTTLLNGYNSLFLSFLQYGNIVWGPNTCLIH